MPKLLGPMTLALFSTTLLAACQSGPDRAGSRPEAPRNLTTVAPLSLVFVEIDQNRDQALSRTELDIGVPTLFSTADQDGDARLGAGELRAWFMRHLGSEYPVPGRLAFDPNGDNAVTGAEFALVFSNAFTRMDTNDDNAVTRAEMIRQLSLGDRGQSVRGAQRRGQRGPGPGRRPG